MGVRYLEDFEPGQIFGSGRLRVDRERIKSFGAEFDPQPFHVDESAARDSFFGGLAASGWHTAAMSMRLIVESVPLAGGVIGAGGEISWPRPTRPGDILQVESEVIELVASRSRPDRASALARCTTRNQKGETVQTLTCRLILQRRAPGTDATATQ